MSHSEIERLTAALTLIGNLPLEFNTRARAIAQEAVTVPPEGWRDPLTRDEIYKVLYRAPLHGVAATKFREQENQTMMSDCSGHTGAAEEAAAPYQPPTIEMIPVESSNIESVGHDGKETLRVKFKGSGSYDYVGIQEDEFFGLVNAPSVGKAYGALTKARGIKGIKL